MIDANEIFKKLEHKFKVTSHIVETLIKSISSLLWLQLEILLFAVEL